MPQGQVLDILNLPAGPLNTVMTLIATLYFGLMFLIMTPYNFLTSNQQLSNNRNN